MSKRSDRATAKAYAAQRAQATAVSKLKRSHDWVAVQNTSITYGELARLLEDVAVRLRHFDNSIELGILAEILDGHMLEVAQRHARGDG